MNEIGLQPVDCRLRYSGGRWPIKFDYIDPCVDQIVLEADLSRTAESPTRCRFRTRNPEDPVQVLGFLTD
ncbi:hypothetical protein COP2_044074 [Malus domestica]